MTIININILRTINEMFVEVYSYFSNVLKGQSHEKVEKIRS
jgi:hypothetical protein